MKRAGRRRRRKEETDRPAKKTHVLRLEVRRCSEEMLREESIFPRSRLFRLETGLATVFKLLLNRG